MVREHELVRRCQQASGAERGERYRELYDRHQGSVYRICLRMTGNAADAMDATQEAFGKVFRRIDDFRFEGNFSTFSPELVGVSTDLYGGTFNLGNVLTDSVDAAHDSSRLAEMQRDIASGVDACRASCDYFPVCGGGNASNKYFENGTFDSTETNACRVSVKALVDALVTGFEGELGIGGDPRAVPALSEEKA